MVSALNTWLCFTLSHISRNLWYQITLKMQHLQPNKVEHCELILLAGPRKDVWRSEWLESACRPYTGVPEDRDSTMINTSHLYWRHPKNKDFCSIKADSFKWSILLRLNHKFIVKRPWCQPVKTKELWIHNLIYAQSGITEIHICRVRLLLNTF